jgi:Family of unknown function (DUF6172)
MKKTYPLTAAGRHPDRVLDAVKHDIRKYLKRERRRPLPEGVDFLDFDCRFGLDAHTATTTALSALISLVDTAARDGASQVYVELLAKPGQRKPRPPRDADAVAATPDRAPLDDAPTSADGPESAA